MFSGQKKSLWSYPMIQIVISLSFSQFSPNNLVNPTIGFKTIFWHCVAYWSLVTSTYFTFSYIFIGVLTWNEYRKILLQCVHVFWSDVEPGAIFFFVRFWKKKYDRLFFLTDKLDLWIFSTFQKITLSKIWGCCQKWILNRFWYLIDRLGCFRDENGVSKLKNPVFPREILADFDAWLLCYKNTWLWYRWPLKHLKDTLFIHWLSKLDSVPISWEQSHIFVSIFLKNLKKTKDPVFLRDKIICRTFFSKSDENKYGARFNIGPKYMNALYYQQYCPSPLAVGSN